MKAQLYYNRSNNNVVSKSLVANGDELTIHIKENTDLFNPVFYISREIDIYQSNYLKVKGDVDRYYYVKHIEVSQQYYIVYCHVDVLMSFKDAIKNQTCIVTRNTYNYNMYLPDDKAHINNISRITTIPFDVGFRENGSKVASMILTLNGGGNS
jgi:hypothetical protein